MPRWRRYTRTWSRTDLQRDAHGPGDEFGLGVEQNAVARPQIREAALLYLLQALGHGQLQLVARVLQERLIHMYVFLRRRGPEASGAVHIVPMYKGHSWAATVRTPFLPAP